MNTKTTVGFRRPDPEERYFRTRNLRLAAVLFARDHALVNVNRTGPRSVEFIFRNSYDLEDLVERLRTGKAVLVDARRFVFSLKLLRNKRTHAPL